MVYQPRPVTTPKSAVGEQGSPPESEVCWPWRLWWLADSEGHPKGGVCRFCRRDVAVPTGGALARAVCMYCALDRGLTPEIDTPLSDGAPSASTTDASKAPGMNPNPNPTEKT